MKIVHICCANFFRDNVGYQENILPKYHVKLGLETHVIASLINKDMEHNKDFIDTPREYFVDGFKVTRIPFSYGKIGQYLRKYKNLYFNLNKIKPDIIFVHGLQFHDIRKVLKYVKNNPNTRLYIDNHGDYFNGAKTWFSRNIMHKIIWKSGAKKIEPYTTKFYGVTPIRCDFLKDMYKINESKIELLVMGADTDKINFEKKDQIRYELRNQLNIDQEDFLIVTGGRLVDRKNIPELLNAIISINNTHKNVKLLMFGVMSDEIEKATENLMANKIVKYIGWISHDEVYNYFLASDLGVFPGTHSVLWEQAIGTGLPCVFKYWEGMQHVDVGGNCIFIKDATVSKIEAVVTEIVEDKECYFNLKDASTKKGIKYFSYSNIAKKSIENSYE